MGPIFLQQSEWPCHQIRFQSAIPKQRRGAKAAHAHLKTDSGEKPKAVHTCIESRDTPHAQRYTGSVIALRNWSQSENVLLHQSQFLNDKFKFFHLYRSVSATNNYFINSYHLGCWFRFNPLSETGLGGSELIELNWFAPFVHRWPSSSSFLTWIVRYFPQCNNQQCLESICFPTYAIWMQIYTWKRQFSFKEGQSLKVT